MAISQTMSNPSDWMLQYQTEFSNITQTEVPPPTTAAARLNNLSPDQGRVAKPVRRRSRASRRTPTTLLNTDATNFRAMVQQFTGGPSAARPQIPNGGSAALSYMEQHAAVDPARGFRVQYANQQQQQQHMFMMDSMHGAAVGRGGIPPQGAAPPPPGNSSSANENRSYDNYMRFDHQ